jgi:alkaline phosphatase D
MSKTLSSITRRNLLLSAGATGLVAGSGLAMPFYARAATRPAFTHGVQSGDVDANSGMIWTRVDRPSRIQMEYSTVESFANLVKLASIDALPESDFAVKRLLENLPSDQDIFYRFVAADLQDINVTSEPLVGRFRTAPTSRRNVRFAWSGDTAGQGWGIDDVGMKTYSTMAKHQPDFFIHSGDTIYADGAMNDSVDFKDGTKWVNKVLIDEKRKVAETLAEYRGQWKYNMMDEHVREIGRASCRERVS